MQVLIRLCFLLVALVPLGCHSPSQGGDTSSPPGKAPKPQEITTSQTPPIPAAPRIPQENKGTSPKEGSLSADLTKQSDAIAPTSKTSPLSSSLSPQPAHGSRPIVEIVTSKGTIEAELYPDKAPISVKNFLSYVEKRHYDGTIFHRVIGPPRNFMIQGGGFTPDMVQKPTDPPIQNEATNGLKNERGTLAFARTREIHSATSQFFINLKHNAFLDHRDTTLDGYGYAVFGKVIKGMDVVDAIARVPTGQRGIFADVPLEPVVIKSIRVKKR